MEFAIVCSVVFLVLFGTIQFGIAFNRYQGVNAAAREGARLASLPATTVDQIRQRVKDSVSIVSGSSLANTCPGTLATDKGCIQVEQPPGTIVGTGSVRPCNLKSGEAVKVSVKYQTLIAIPLWKSPSVTVTGDGEFRCE